MIVKMIVFAIYWITDDGNSISISFQSI